MYLIYEILNPVNGKKYIGCTSKSLTSRFDNGNGYVNNAPLYKDIKDIGWESFIKRTICSIESKAEALEAEEKYILEINTLEPYGYNLRSGGRSNFPVESVCENISKSKMGHTVEQEVRKRLSEFNCKAIVQLTLDYKYIKTYSSLTKAAADVGAKKTNIYAVCKGYRQSSKGFRWAYVKSWNDAKVHELEDRVKHSTKMETLK